MASSCFQIDKWRGIWIVLWEIHIKFKATICVWGVCRTSNENLPVLKREKEKKKNLKSPPLYLSHSWDFVSYMKHIISTCCVAGIIIRPHNHTQAVHSDTVGKQSPLWTLISPNSKWKARQKELKTLSCWMLLTECFFPNTGPEALSVFLHTYCLQLQWSHAKICLDHKGATALNFSLWHSWKIMNPVLWRLLGQKSTPGADGFSLSLPSCWEIRLRLTYYHFH